MAICLLGQSLPELPSKSMASFSFQLLPLRTPLNNTHPPRPLTPLSNPNSLCSFHVIPQSGPTHHPILRWKRSVYRSKTLSLSQTRTPPASRTPTSRPPSSREEAILQAKTCLSSTLQKPLNNPVVLPSKKLKKQRQPRFRVEIPVVDDSQESLSQLAVDVFSDLQITRKGAPASILIIWADPTLAEAARKAFVDMSQSVVNSDMASANAGVLSSANMVVFLAPESSALEQMRRVCEDIYPKPVVLFNPKWNFEEEEGFPGGLGSYAGTFEVVYSFMGLEVRGILSSRKGMVCRSVTGGVLSGEGWVVFVEDEENKGEMKEVTRFKKRPAIGDVESVLYNLMAANSPVTKSVKFLRDLASNVTGKKRK